MRSCLLQLSVECGFLIAFTEGDMSTNNGGHVVGNPKSTSSGSVVGNGRVAKARLAKKAAKKPKKKK